MGIRDHMLRRLDKPRHQVPKMLHLLDRRPRLRR